MKTRLLTSLLVLGLRGSYASAQSANDPARFAIVIGQNASDRPQQPRLLYADDDAVATHRLLEQAGVTSVLLVSLDEDSQRLHPELKPAGPPTRDNLLSAFWNLKAQMEKVRSTGQEVEFLFVYSGHGNVEHGEGYIVLEQSRLTRSDLYQEILAESPANRNHVIVDACKSYYLAFEKGPGGERKPYTKHFVEGEGAKRTSNTGFLLSTSSGRDSHEWERFQSGVFSHEVRSALRGGACRAYGCVSCHILSSAQGDEPTVSSKTADGGHAHRNRGASMVPASTDNQILHIDTFAPHRARPALVGTVEFTPAGCAAGAVGAAVECDPDPGSRACRANCTS